MRRTAVIVFILSCLFVLMFSSVSYANSSWHWVTASPMKVFPFAVFFTLIIETAAVVIIGKVADVKKSIIVVGLANLFSFLAPYVIRAYNFIPTSGGFKLWAAFEKGPYYMVLSGYLILTLIVELPVVYLMLLKESSKTGLAAAILASNIITTLLVAVSERLICIGSW